MKPKKKKKVGLLLLYAGLIGRAASYWPYVQAAGESITSGSTGTQKILLVDLQTVCSYSCSFALSAFPVFFFLSTYFSTFTSYVDCGLRRVGVVKSHPLLFFLSKQI